mgnify:FL=1
MKNNVFDWHHSLFYGEKLKFSDFETKNPTSLDALLKKIYMLAHERGFMSMKDSLPAFNAAYYVAACLTNTENLHESFSWEKMNSATEKIWWEDAKRRNRGHCGGCSMGQLILVRWMVYAILSRQACISDEVKFFLQVFRKELMEIITDEHFCLSETSSYFLDIPDMIDRWIYRYHTDLRPHPLHPKHYTSHLWESVVCKYSMDELELQLSFFPTIKEQMAFLNWAKEETEKSGILYLPFPPDTSDLPFPDLLESPFPSSGIGPLQ